MQSSNPYNQFASVPALATKETDVQPELGQTPEDVRTPSATLSLKATTYQALHEGTTANILSWLETRVIQPNITDTERPKLQQSQVNQLWSDAGITSAPPDANKYNDVGIYTLIDKAKHREAAEAVDQATNYSIAGTPLRGATTLALSIVDPVNAIAGFFPAAGVARAVGLTGVASSLGALGALGTTGATLATRVTARAGIGAIEGAIGNIPIEAISAPIRNEMGEDYTATQSLQNILLGSAIGGGLHVAIGGLSSKINNTPIARTENTSKLFGKETADQLNAILPDNYTNANKVIEASSLVTKPIVDNIAVKESIKGATDYMATPPEARATKEILPENTILADYIESPQSSSRMVAEAIDNYHEAIISAEKLDTPIDKAVLMQEAIDKVQRTTADLTQIVTAQTRETAAKVAMAQSLDEKFPTVDNILKADRNINESNLSDVVREVKQSDDYKNSYVTMEANKIVAPEKIPFENELTPEQSTARTEAKIADFERLEQAGILYSKKSEEINATSNTPKLTELQDIKKQLEAKLQSANSHEQWAGLHLKLSDTLNKIKVLEGKPLPNPETLSTQSLYDSYISASPFYSKSIVKSFESAVGKSPGAATQKVLASLIKAFGNDADKLLKTSRLKIVEDVKDLPGVHSSNVKGMTVLPDGKVYLVAKNLTPEQVRGVVLHEIGVHSNMQNLLGSKGYSNLLKQVDKLLVDDPVLSNLLDSIIPNDTPVHLHAEEKLAYLVENAPKLQIVQQVLAKIRAWLFEHFPSLQKSLNLKQGDIAAIAMASLRNYARKETIKSIKAGNVDAVLYSRAEEIADQTQSELDTIDKLNAKLNQYNVGLKTIAEELADIDDPKIFRELIEENIGRISETESKDLQNMFNRAVARNKENGVVNPTGDAVDYVTKQLKDNWTMSKKTLIWDRLIKKRAQPFIDSMTDLPEDAIKGLLIGTANQRKGTLSQNAALAIKTIEDKYLSDFENKVILAGLKNVLESKSFDDDIMRAMYALQTNDTAKLNGLSKESVQLAHIIEDNYNSMLTELNNTGLTVNKIKGYYFNQLYMHDQQRIHNAGAEDWIDTAKRLFDIDRMAEELNMKLSDFDEAFWQESYRRFDSGEHNDAGSNTDIGGYSGFNSAEPFRNVNIKQRKYHFKDVEGAIEYWRKYGNKSLLGGIAGTVKANARKLGLVQTLGVNYERNINEIYRYLDSKVEIPEQRKKLNKIKYDMGLMVRALDGRSDIPVSGALSRIGSNVRAILSMTMLSKAGIAGLFGDPMNAAIQDVKLGMTKLPLPLQYINRIFEIFKRYSPEKKAIVRSMGVATENLLMDAYRYDSIENDVSGVIARAMRWFFKANFIDKQGSAMKMSAADMISSAHAGFVKVPYDELSAGLKRYLERFNINETDWSILSKSKLLQVDGKEYLIAETINDLKAEALTLMQSRGLKADVASLAADRYLNDLSNRLSMYYRDLIARQYLEPDQVSKYYNSWKGARRGTAAGEAIQFAMQFKQYGINFWRNIILDEVYSRHDTATDFGKSLVADWSSEGIKQKTNILWKLGSFALAGIFISSLYDILGGRKPRVTTLQEDRSAKNLFDIFFTGLYRSGGLGFLGDYLFTDYSRYGTSFAGALAGAGASRFGEFVGLVTGGATSSYKLLTGEEAPDQASRWFKFAKGMLPSTFYSSIIMNYALWYGIQESLNPGSLRRMERRMQNLSNQQFIAPPSQYAYQPF